MRRFSCGASASSPATRCHSRRQLSTSTGQQRRLADLPLEGNYVDEGGDEWIVPVRWLKHQLREKAFWKTGLFANQNSAVELRNRFTLEQLIAEFGLDDDAAAESH